MAIRTGYMKPLGKAAAATGGDMSDSFSGQVQFLFDIGGKISKNVFVGGYLGFGLGATSGQLAAMCSGGVSCYTHSLRGGAEVQYHFAPGGPYNFWVGYGLGVEDSGYKASSSDGSLDASLEGFEFAHLMAGLDFRLSKGIGIGPTVAFTAAQYWTVTFDHGTSTPISGSIAHQSTSASIANQSIHEWFFLGARLTLFP